VKVAFFNDIAVLGGGEIWVLGACRQLAAMGHQAMVFCPWRSELHARCLAEGIEVFSYLRIPGVPVYEPLYHAVRKRDIDVLYCTVMGAFCEAAVLGALVDRLNRDRPARPLPLILKTGLPPMSGLSPEYYGVGFGPAIPRLHVVSEQTRQAFLRWLPRIDPDYVEVMWEGINLSRFDPGPTAPAVSRTRWGVTDRDRVVTCVARLHTTKGLDNLILAAPQVLERHPDTRFLLAGEGDQRRRLEELRDHLGLGRQVRFLGHVDDVPSLLRATDVLCHPSLADGMPNAIVEAMASGVPVVASDVGGIRDVVRHGDNGLLVAAHDIREISRSLNRLLDTPDLAAQFARNGQTVVRERFDMRRNLELLIARLEHEKLGVTRAYAAGSPGRKQKRQVKPVDVLFLMNAFRIGGEETEILTLARHLNPRRIRLHAAGLYPLDEPATVARLQGAGVSIDTRCHALPAEADKAAHIRALIRERQIRVVVACQDTRLAYRVFQGLKPEECSLVEHGGILLEVSTIPKDRTARYIGVSNAIRDAAATRMEDPAAAVCLPSMVDTGEYDGLDRAGLRAAYGFAADTCVATFVGRLDPKKRVEDFLRAGLAVQARNPKVRLLVVGGPDGIQPEYAQNLFRCSAEHVESGRVTFTGARMDVPEILTASDILVLPAVDEGMSHAINEAGAAALAVIAVDDGAAREQLDGDAAGRLVPPARPDLLAHRLAELVENPKLRRALGRRLRARVRKQFSAAALVPRWESLLGQVAAPGLERHQALIESWDHPLDFPAEIQIQTITTCNAACIMCPYPEVSTEFAFDRMEEQLYDRILEECAREPGLRRIEPFLMNEAFTDSRIIDWIARAKRKVPHAMVTVTTNGAPLVPKVTDRLVRSGLDAIWFSFNGATRDTYEKIMGVPYDRVKANIDYLLEVRPPSLQVFVNMIETGMMAPEIAANIRYWQTRGVQAGSSPLVNRAGNVRNFEELRYTPQGALPVRTCELVFYKMYILASGDVVLCCMDWRRQVLLGNVRRQTLREIWNGEAYRRVRRLHVEGEDRMIDLCRSCSYTLS